jgi:hypothetical protein
MLGDFIFAARFTADWRARLTEDELLELAKAAFDTRDVERAMKAMDKYLATVPPNRGQPVSAVELWRAARRALADDDRIATQRDAFERKRDKVFPTAGY